MIENGIVEDSDDEKPIVFKRTSGVVSNSKSNTQRSNAVSSTKASPLKSPVTKPNGTTASNKTSSKALPAKPPLRNDTTPSSVKAKGQSQKEQSECKSERDDSDSDDEKPLSSIRTGNSSRSNKGPASSKQVASPQAEKKNTGGRPLDGADRVIKDESDDEKPISSMVQKKSGMSGSQKVSSDEKKPLMKKLNQNGSAVKNEVPDCKVSGKRPVEKNHPVDESSSKKPKVSASSTSGKMKQEPVKTESSADKGRVLVSPTAKRARPVSMKEDYSDDDDVPISKRLKPESSNSKVSSAKPKAVKGNSSSSAAKPKVTKVVSPPSRSKTVNRNGKKVTKDSKYSSSSKSSPSSSDGQTKWTTLEHNGVIFPPLYKPHGIKILYKGKPVDLTIEQEEVILSIHTLNRTDYIPLQTFLNVFLVHLNIQFTFLILFQ